MNLPNLISLGRILAVPLTVWLVITGQFMFAFWVFIAAGISDAIDGIIAKRFNAETVLGAFLDPLADKALLVSIYVTLGHEALIPMWLVILVVFRDLLILGGAILFHTITHTLTMDPLKISKINTLLQIVLAAAVLWQLAFGIDIGVANDIM
ncbi:MAG: CDP-alcohol phosphatidyltransferase family protein, partial [Rhodospirillales bacterium]|nr:CDP-alcohol phosphatidyltransferase family protein [Rhodospirillales bacterium]